MPPDFWEREKERLLGLLLPILERLSIAGAKSGAEKLRDVGIEFDDTLANAAAARWARQRAGELIELLTATSRKLIGQVMGNWIETPGSTLGSLAEQLLPITGQNADRAFTIAVTETTNAYSAGEVAAYEEAGLPRAVFAPAAHPRCRCWPRPKRLKTGEWVVLWTTNRDEIVCKTPITTPWGVVEGCRELHNTVISEGPYLGKNLKDIDG